MENTSQNKPLKQIEVHETYTQIIGPIPPPQILKDYNYVVPDAAERIIRMAEKQSDHRIQLENKVIKSDINKSYIGMFLAASIAIYGLYIAKDIAINGNPWAAGIIAALDLGGLISVSIYNQICRKKELDERRAKSSTPPSPKK